MSRALRRAAIALLVFPVRAYAKTISPLRPRRCKYHPTCSAYAVEALRSHGPLTGSGLALWRLLRCNPLSRGGYDPVPPARPTRRDEALG